MLFRSARTIARWKNERSMSPSASAIALMRIIRTYPWVLAVADMQFDHEAARKILLQHAAKELVKISSEHPEVEVTSNAQMSGNHFELFIKGSKKIIPEVVSSGNNVFEFLR